MLLKLNYTVTSELLDQAIQDLPSDNFRYTINQPTGNFFYDPWTVKEEFKNTVWEEILKTLPVEQGEARIIILDPAQCYQSHSDIDDRYHLNISGDHSYLIDLESEQMYKLIRNGHWYQMNAGPKHSAANFGRTTRIQIVVRKLLNTPLLNDPVHVKLTTECQTGRARFIFDDTISPWLNEMNKQEVLSDFYFQGAEVRFKVERRYLDRFKKILTDDFKLEIL